MSIDYKKNGFNYLITDVKTYLKNHYSVKIKVFRDVKNIELL